MPELLTPRLRCSPLQLDDWSFSFPAAGSAGHALRGRPRPQAAIREAFDSRLPPWTTGDAHWLCLVVRDRLTHTPLGLTGYLHHQRDIAEVGFLFAPAAQGRGYGYESLRALCDYAFTTGGVRRLTATVTAGNEASKQLLLKAGFRLEGSCGRTTGSTDAGTTTGCSVGCARRAMRPSAPPLTV